MIGLARPYAQAAFEYAVAQQQTASWSALLEALAQAIAQPVIQQLLDDPRYSARQLAAVTLAFVDDKLDQAGKNFVNLLAEHHRLVLLPEIATLFAEYLAVHENRLAVEVCSAIPLSDKEQQELQQSLAKRLQLTIELNCQVNPALLGGLLLRMRDKVIDNSIRGQFARLKTMLSGN